MASLHDLLTSCLRAVEQGAPSSSSDYDALPSVSLVTRMVRDTHPSLSRESTSDGLLPDKPHTVDEVATVPTPVMQREESGASISHSIEPIPYAPPAAPAAPTEAIATRSRGALIAVISVLALLTLGAVGLWWTRSGSAPVEVAITSAPAGAEVELISGASPRPLGATPLTTQIAFHDITERATLRFRKQGYADYTYELSAEGDASRAIAVELAPLPEQDDAPEQPAARVDQDAPTPLVGDHTGDPPKEVRDAPKRRRPSKTWSSDPTPSKEARDLMMAR